MKPLAIIYIFFVFKVIYEVNNNLFLVVVRDLKIPSLATPTMNVDLGCHMCHIVSLKYVTLLVLTSEAGSDLFIDNG